MNLTLFEDVSLDNWLQNSWESEDITEDDKEALVMELITRQTASIEKVNTLLKFVSHLNGFAEICKNEISRIEQKKDSAETLISRIKEGIKNYLELKGLKSFEAGTYKITLRDSDHVEITDIELVPPEFKTIIINISKSGIKEELKKGKYVPGAMLKKSSFIQIR